MMWGWSAEGRREVHAAAPTSLHSTRLCKRADSHAPADAHHDTDVDGREGGRERGKEMRHTHIKKKNTIDDGDDEANSKDTTSADSGALMASAGADSEENKNEREEACKVSGENRQETENKREETTKHKEVEENSMARRAGFRSEPSGVQPSSTEACDERERERKAGRMARRRHEPKDCKGQREKKKQKKKGQTRERKRGRAMKSFTWSAMALRLRLKGRRQRRQGTRLRLPTARWSSADAA